jgi:hypothetical protein
MVVARKTAKPESTMAETIALALRVAIVWAAGMVLAVGVQALLPKASGITLYGKQSTLFVSFSRMGFWTCLLATVTVTALIVIRAMLQDVGWQSFR